MKTRRLQFLRSYVPPHLSLMVDFSTEKLVFSTRPLRRLVREKASKPLYLSPDSLNPWEEPFSEILLPHEMRKQFILVYRVCK